MSKLRASTFFCAFSITRVSRRFSIASPSSTPTRSHHCFTRSASKMRSRSSSSERKNWLEPGIALAAGAAAQLVVDAPALVPLGAEDVQPARARPPRCARRRTGPRSARTSPRYSGCVLSPPHFASASISGLPPSTMSVPRPAMLVEIVTAPLRPACATISASRSWCLAFSTLCRTPCLPSLLASISEVSIEIVPTSTGWPVGVALLDVVDHRVELLALRS